MRRPPLEEGASLLRGRLRVRISPQVFVANGQHTEYADLTHFQYAWRESPAAAGTRQAHTVRPTNLLIIFLLRVLESNFPGKPPINLHGHENSHTLELRVCLSQTLSETHSLSRRTGRRHRGHVSLAASTTDKQ